MNRVARVYRSGGAVFGCAGGSKRTYRLGSGGRSIREGTVSPVGLAEDSAAFGLSRSGVDTISANLVVRRLRDGAVLHNEPATSRPVGPEFFERVTSVVVRPDGAAAWISTAGSVISGRAREIEVNRVDSRGRVLLDSGAAIDPQSLRLHRGRITWRHGQATRSAFLR